MGDGLDWIAIARMMAERALQAKAENARPDQRDALRSRVTAIRAGRCDHAPEVMAPLELLAAIAGGEIDKRKL